MKKLANALGGLIAVWLILAVLSVVSVALFVALSAWLKVAG